jgi:hypothetical protein
MCYTEEILDWLIVVYVLHRGDIETLRFILLLNIRSPVTMKLCENLLRLVMTTICSAVTMVMVQVSPTETTESKSADHRSTVDIVMPGISTKQVCYYSKKLRTTWDYKSFLLKYVLNAYFCKYKISLKFMKAYNN